MLTLPCPPTSLLGQFDGESGAFFYPPGHSHFAPSFDMAFDVIFWISTFFFVLIVGVMAVFVVLYRRRPGHVEQVTAHHNTTLEIVWSVIPALLILAMFGAGVVGYINARQPPANPYEVNVIARQWEWSFVYDRIPGGVNELHLPPGRPIKLTMSSADVLHSFYVPEFRTKMDVVPGRYTYLWFEPNAPPPDGEPREYRLYCTEYCGRGHSRMSRKVVVHPTLASFEAWLEEASNPYKPAETLAQVGEQIYVSQGCKACHAVNDQLIAGGGPSWKGTWGTTQQTTAGPVTVDLDYLRESIEYPTKKIRTGFAGGNMPSYLGRFKPIDYYAIAAFMKKLSEPGYKQSPEEDRLLEEAKKGNLDATPGTATSAPAADRSGDGPGATVPTGKDPATGKIPDQKPLPDTAPVNNSGGRGAETSDNPPVQSKDASDKTGNSEPENTQATGNEAAPGNKPAADEPAKTKSVEETPADQKP